MRKWLTAESTHVDVVLERPNHELSFVLRQQPELAQQTLALFASGGTVSISTQQTPRRVVMAVERVSRLSQRNCTVTWLPAFVERGIAPRITERDQQNAAEEGVNLTKELRCIQTQVTRYKTVQVTAPRLTPRQCQRLQKKLQAAFIQAQRKYAARRLVFDSARKRTEIAQAIIKILLLIGPVAHILEHFARGWGKVFAASIDDLMTETAEFFALHGAGFPWSSIAKRAFALIGVFVVATLTVLHVEDLLARSDYFLAGFLYGLCAVALSLTTAVQSIFMFRTKVWELEQEGKYQGKNGWWQAIVQDFTNPARQGLFLGALLSPLLAGCIFFAFHGIVHNGWVLAALGSTETFVAGLTVIGAERLSEQRYQNSLKD